MNVLKSPQFSLAVSAISSIGLGYYIYSTNSELEKQIGTLLDRINAMELLFKDTVNKVSQSGANDKKVVDELTTDLENTKRTLSLLKETADLLANRMGYSVEKKSRKGRNYKKRNSSRYDADSRSKGRKSRRGKVRYDDSEDEQEEQYKSRKKRGERASERRRKSSYDSEDDSEEESYEEPRRKRQSKRRSKRKYDSDDSSSSESESEDEPPRRDKKTQKGKKSAAKGIDENDDEEIDLAELIAELQS